MVNIKFNSEKALEAILYVASKAPIPDIYHVIKVLYFADFVHLEKYGRLITNDTYIAMKDGPVASNAYDIIKVARNCGRMIPNGLEVRDIMSSLVVDEIMVKPLRAPEEDVFSDSDVSCLDEAIKNVGHLKFSDIRTMSHGKAWRSANENGEIDLLSLADECSRGNKDLIDYITTGA